MKSELTIKDVVERAALDRRTAKYLLQREGFVARFKLPVGEHRKHRSFNVNQAIRLALCTQLVMVGVPIACAEDTTQWAERRWKVLTREQPDLEHLFDGIVTNPWNIRLLHYGKYAQMSRDRPDRRNNLEMLEDIDAFYRTEDWKLVRFVEIPRHIPLIEWSLSELAGSLARTK